MAFERQKEAAKRAIVKNGAAANWLVKAVETTDEEPWKPQPVVPPNHPVHIVLLPEGRIGSEWAHLLAGFNLQAGNDYGLMHYVDFVPSISDTVVFTSGRVLQPVTIDRLAPNDIDVILYTIRFAR